jgi:histidine ammonia-lyase
VGTDRAQAQAPEREPGEIVLGTSTVVAADVVAVARHDARVRLAPEALQAMAASRRVVDGLAASPTPAYGISTGFGALATRHITPELRARLQLSLIRSHAAGVGEPVEREVVRALVFLRLKTLASGIAGVRPVVAETRASTRWCLSTGRSAAAGTWHRSRTVPSCSRARERR